MAAVDFENHIQICFSKTLLQQCILWTTIERLIEKF